MVGALYSFAWLFAAMLILPASPALEQIGETEISSQQPVNSSVQKYGPKSLPSQSEMTKPSSGGTSPVSLAIEASWILREVQDNQVASFDATRTNLHKRSKSHPITNRRSLDGQGRSLLKYLIQSFAHQIRSMQRPYVKKEYRRQSKYFGFSNPYLKFVSEDPQFWDFYRSPQSKETPTRNSRGESIQYMINSNYK